MHDFKCGAHVGHLYKCVKAKGLLGVENLRLWALLVQLCNIWQDNFEVNVVGMLQ